MTRYLSDIINDFAQNKFVLIAGPRQVGKTTMAKEWLGTGKETEKTQNPPFSSSTESNSTYLNWDIAEDRQIILQRSFLTPATPNRLVLDEIHKYRRWKGLLKGLFDQLHSQMQVIVTGSARLDVYQRGGDSLFGRYELLHLHPFSVGELIHGSLPQPPADWLSLPSHINSEEKWEHLNRFSGFPEPFAAGDELFFQRWSTRRRELLIREDLRELTEIKQLDLVEHLYLLLPDRIGSPLSTNALAEDVQVSFNTIDSWLTALERLYIVFRLKPYHSKLTRALRKSHKLYLWDWAQVPDRGARFENMVACHLLKSAQAWSDVGYGEYEVMYWRNKEKQEVDFVLLNHRKPVAIFECKLSDTSIAPELTQLSKALGNLPAIQLVQTPGVDFRHGQVRVVTASALLAGLV